MANAEFLVPRITLTTVEKAIIMGALREQIESETTLMMPGAELYVIRGIDRRRELIEKVKAL